MTVSEDARIAIVFKKLDEARLRLSEAASIYEHLLDDRSTPLDVGMGSGACDWKKSETNIIKNLIADPIIS